MELPLHPAIVHLPIGIVFVMPFITLLLVFLFRRKIIKKSGFVIIVALHIFLVGTSYLALETGEEEEHRVEKVVNEQFIESHEEKAEIFMAISSLVLIGSFLLFLLPASRFLSLGLGALFVSQLALIFLGYQVGHTGGELVYVHGAAKAYAEKVKNSSEVGTGGLKERAEHEDDDEDEDDD